MSQPEDLGVWFRKIAKAKSPDHYHLLSITRFESEQSAILEAVAAKVEFLHEVSGHQDYTANAQRILNEVAKAKICLTTPAQKAKYDQELVSPTPELAIEKSDDFAEASPDSDPFSLPAPALPPIKTKPRRPIKKEPDTLHKVKTKSNPMVWIKPVTSLVLIGVIIGLAFWLFNRNKQSDSNQLSSQSIELIPGTKHRNDNSKPRTSNPKNTTKVPTTNEPKKEPDDNLGKANPAPQLAAESGELIENIIVTATNSHPQSSPMMLTDGIGLENGGKPNAVAHRNTEIKQYWCASNGFNKPVKVSEQSLTFEFPRSCFLNSIYIWNYNAKGKESRAVKELEILLSSDEDPDTAEFKSLGVFELEDVLRGKIYGKRIAMAVRRVRLVKFNIISSQSGKENDFVGLAEVRFFKNGKAGPWAKRLTLSAPVSSDAKDATIQPPVYQPTIDLPEITAKEPIELVRFNGDKKPAILIELFAKGKAKLTFQTRKNESNKSEVIVSRHEKDKDSTDIAVLAYQESSVVFNWLDTAAEDESNNYLRNSIAKITMAQDDPVWISLRRPATIGEFQFTDDDDSNVRSEADLEWAPDKRDLQVKVSSFADASIVSPCNPDMVTKDPAKMFFANEAAKQFAWYEVDFDARASKSQESSSTFRLTAKLRQLFPRSKPTNSRPKSRALKTSDLVDIKAEYNKVNDQFEQQIAKLADGPEKTNLAKWVDEFAMWIAVCDSTDRTIRQTFGKSIPVDIYIELEGQKVIIATTRE